mmetsp:Transcript_83572/g.190661  ORF Transcript_83572/g.190661 Transcript_83572/m.190661 type:complete len:622 (+) Transcript_83572:316-2181(+)
MVAFVAPGDEWWACASVYCNRVAVEPAMFWPRETTIAAAEDRPPVVDWEAEIAAGNVKPDLGLLKSAELGDARTLEYLVLQKADVEQVGDEKRRAIHFACMSGHAAAVQMLLTAKADVTVGDKFRATPFLCAAASGSLAACQVLASAAEDPADLLVEKDLWKQTPLLKAAKSGSAELVDWLLTQKSAVSTKDRNGETVLHCAVAGKAAEIVVRLAKEQGIGSILDLTNNDELSPLDAAVAANCPEVGDALYLAGAKKMREKVGRGPALPAVQRLQTAAKDGLGFACRAILSQPKNISVVNEVFEGKTALLVASEQGKLSAVQALVDMKADFRKAEDGQSVLSGAAAAGHKEVVEWLIDAKVDVSERDSRGWTALSHAVCGGHLSLAETLLGLGAEVDAEDDAEAVPTMHACHSGSLEGLDWLVQRSADLTREDWEGKTVAHYACSGGQVACLRRVAELGVNVHEAVDFGTTPLHLAAATGAAAVVQALLDLKGDAAAKRANGRVPLHDACEAGHVEVVKILAKDTAEVPDTDARRPWHVAASFGHAEVLKELAPFVSDKQAVDSIKWSALHLAAAAGKKEAIEVLVSLGVTDSKDEDGFTAADWAGKRGHGHMAELIPAPS